MIEKGTVIRLDGRELWIKASRSECAGCSGHCSCKVEDHLFQSLNPKNLNVKSGDSVAISVPPGETKRSSFTLLLLPLILFLGNLFAAQSLLPVNNRLLEILLGLLGLGLGFALIVCYIRFKWPDGKPVLTELLEERP